METNRPRELSIIIVNYNTADTLYRCLNSIASQKDIKPEVIVVDNASQDNSHDIIKENFLWVKLITNKHNLGFARANNQALKSCKAKYVYFLNPDTELRQGALRAIIEFMESHPEVGLAGTRIINPDGSPQSSVEKRYPGEKHAKQDLKGLGGGGIAWVLGASMIVRRGIVEDLGGFDESFFLYGEEQDLCLRVRKAGSTIGYVPDSVVIHLGGQSERNTLPVDIWKKKFDAEFLFYRKHYSKQAIRAIRRANLIQALWRIFTLNLTLPFCKNKEVSQEKLDKYRLMFTTFRERKILHNDSSTNL
ncbi:MAG: glycosyltransferase family 2 protein [Proteobacteria bacterium]|nr:glycosyltransferase family 2 protein [Pseudomonadota bacterium]